MLEKEEKAEGFLKGSITQLKPGNSHIFLAKESATKPSGGSGVWLWIILIITSIIIITSGVVVWLFLKKRQERLLNQEEGVNHILKIDEMFGKEIGVVMMGKRKKISKILASQLDENQNCSKINVDIRKIHNFKLI